jgi:hypothetical protein
MPQADIKCNGGDAGVVVPDSENVVLTIDIQARQFAGFNGDIGCIINMVGGGYYTYDGSTGTWVWDCGGIYYSGPLMDISDTILDQLVKVGDYQAWLVLDRVYNGILDNAHIYDMVDFQVKSFQVYKEDFDDGVADNWIPDGTHWSVPVDTYYLDTPFYDNFVSYLDADYTDFAMCSADMRQVDTGSFSNYYYYGLLVRSDGTLDNCVTLYVTNQGSSYCYSRSGGLGTLLGSGTLVNFIPNAGNWNNLGMSGLGSNYEIYCNGALEYSVSDPTYTTGKFGLRGEGTGIYDHEYEYDNFMILY